MKRILLSLYVFLSTLTSYGQDWVSLEYPMSGILGRPYSDINYNKKEQVSNISWETGIKYDKNPQIDSYESAESITEYEDKFRSFITRYFNTDKQSVKNVEAYSLKVRSLNQGTIDDLQEGAKYIYEGITADSVTITVGVKKNFNADISKAINDAANVAFNGAQSTELVNKILPVLDSISFESNDSIYYKATIKNPNVYYKVRAIKLKTLSKHDWDNICLYFADQEKKKYPQTKLLTYDPSEVKSRTLEYYPEFWGKNDNKKVLYSLGLKKENGQLKLLLYESNANVKGSLKPIREIPYIDEEGKRYWRMDRDLIYQFYHNKRIKKVYIQVAAKQIDNNSIEIINWDNNSSCRNAVTYMRYPEFKAAYTNK